ncbi:MAG: hypothetical protein Q7P63_04570 [Verrucomicrobiota bacterium JB022]|nr:hypothetical protein [Verrucomicrobiota bacterium JB022]
MSPPPLLNKDTGITLALAVALCGACFSAGIFYQSHQEHGAALLELKQIARTNSELLARLDLRIIRLEQLIEEPKQR